MGEEGLSKSYPNELYHSSSVDEEQPASHKKPALQQRNSWPMNHKSPAISPRGPLKSHLAKMKEEVVVEEVPSNDTVQENNVLHSTADLLADDTVPDPEKQRHVIDAIDSECTCTYAVAKVWYRKWEEHVGIPKGTTAGQSEVPGPLEMDLHNDTNNEFINEDIWKLLIHWYGLSPMHQLDRKHLYFKDEKMFDVCVLSPFSGIVEHQVKKFNRFEEIGYIECQLRRIFHVSDHKRSRMWISEKAQVPRFRQLLLRFRMLNDCLHRDKVYILALEVCQGDHTWPTGEPGEPKGDLVKYKDIVNGRITDDYWTQEVSRTLGELQEAVSASIMHTTEAFLQNSQCVLKDKQRHMDAIKSSLEVQTKEATSRIEDLNKRSDELGKREDKIAADTNEVKALQQEVTSQQERFREQLEQAESMHRIQQSKIKLDIGGQLFTTSMQTLRRDEESMLAAMFSGRFELKQESDGSYFIDRDGTYFRYILNFLRDGCIEAGTLPNDMFMVKELLREARYYQLTSLIKELEERLAAASNGK